MISTQEHGTSKLVLLLSARNGGIKVFWSSNELIKLRNFAGFFHLYLIQLFDFLLFLPFVFWHFLKNNFCENDKVPEKVFEKTKIEAFIDS